MTPSNAPENASGSGEARRARVVVLGEFSAGKSTLINLLTGQSSLRTQITATQMPPVWMSYGTDPAYRVDLDGNSHPVDPTDPSQISVTDTAYIRVFIEAPALKLCDLIDTPGNSDPNIAAEAWERVAKLADVAIWCSSSTQAWRQSELAAWQEVPESVRARSILLLTRADKINSESDREKILRRIRREAGGSFSHIHMASLLDFDNISAVLEDLRSLCNSVGGSSNTDTATASAVAHANLPDTGAIIPGDAPATELQKADAVEATDPDADLDSLLNEDAEGDLAALAALEAEYDASDDTDDVLAALTAEVNDDEPEEEPEKEPEEAPEPVAIGSGYATVLWTQMASAIPSDDPDAYALAFDMFLEQMDTEIATLRQQASMKVAS